MEVDTTSSRDTYLKEGHCFLCGEKGHIQHACLQKDKKATTPSRNPFRSTSANAISTPSKEDQIRALLNDMSQTEKDAILKDFA